MSDIQVGVLEDELLRNWGGGHPTGVAKETKTASKLEIEFNGKLKTAGERKHRKAAPEDAVVGEKREREGVVEEQAEEEAGKVAKKAKVLPDAAVIQEFPTPITSTVSRTAAVKPLISAAALKDKITALQKSMQDVTERCRSIGAKLDNAGIANANLRALTIDNGTMVYRAKKKQITGDGTALANDLAPTGNNIAQLTALPQPPIVGAVYAPRTINTDNFTHQTILTLVQFYNEDFNILVGDDVAVRSHKIREWLIC
ncbi:hypothetical protein JOM56_012013 [Amanita muscaria]